MTVDPGKLKELSDITLYVLTLEQRRLISDAADDLDERDDHITRLHEWIERCLYTPIQSADLLLADCDIEIVENYRPYCFKVHDMTAEYAHTELGLSKDVVWNFLQR